MMNRHVRMDKGGMKTLLYLCMQFNNSKCSKHGFVNTEESGNRLFNLYVYSSLYNDARKMLPSNNIQLRLKDSG
jgi:hypothetical protein